MTLQVHRSKEFLGGVVYLLTIDMSVVTGNPDHIRRFVNTFTDKGLDVKFQGNFFKTHPYSLASVSRNQKASKNKSKILISDNEDLAITRFVDEVGGSLQGARIFEMKVYGKFLDTGTDSNPLAYSKRLEHVVSYTEDSAKDGELIIHTVDPLSKGSKIPTISFSAGIPNGTESAINIFPAVDRQISSKR